MHGGDLSGSKPGSEGNWNNRAVMNVSKSCGHELACKLKSCVNYNSCLGCSVRHNSAEQQNSSTRVFHRHALCHAGE
jgi:hypothetical protein